MRAANEPAQQVGANQSAASSADEPSMRPFIEEREETGEARSSADWKSQAQTVVKQAVKTSTGGQRQLVLLDRARSSQIDTVQSAAGALQLHAHRHSFQSPHLFGRRARPAHLASPSPPPTSGGENQLQWQQQQQQSFSARRLNNSHRLRLQLTSHWLASH